MEQDKSPTSKYITREQAEVCIYGFFDTLICDLQAIPRCVFRTRTKENDFHRFVYFGTHNNPTHECSCHSVGMWFEESVNEQINKPRSRKFEQTLKTPP